MLVSITSLEAEKTPSVGEKTLMIIRNSLQVGSLVMTTVAFTWKAEQQIRFKLLNTISAGF